MQRAELVKKALGFGGVALALFFLWRALADTDLRAAVALLACAGLRLLLALPVFAIGMAVDAAGFQRVFGALGRRVPLARLWTVRFSSEAVAISMPAGALASETVHPWLLERVCGVPAREAVAAIACKRWMMMRAHGVYIALAALVGWPLFARISPSLVHGRWLPYGVLAAAAAPLAASFAIEATLARGKIARRVLAALTRSRFGAALAKRAPAFEATDENLARLSRMSLNPGSAPAYLLFLGAWLLEACESFVILRLLGVDAGIADALALEGGVSILRSVGFFAPGGLGLMDLGYVAVLRASGVEGADAVAAAFVAVKRGKDIVWSLFGWSLIARLAARGREAASRRSTLPIAAPGGEVAR